MVKDSLQMVADWLGREDMDRTGGVNSVLADRYPNTPRLKGVFDVTRDVIAAEQKEPNETPVIYVQPFEFSIDGEVNAGLRDSSTSGFFVTYITADYERIRAVNDTLNTLHAIQISLDAMSLNDEARSRNGVVIESFNDMVHGLTDDRIGAYKVNGVLTLNAFVRDARARQ